MRRLVFSMTIVTVAVAGSSLAGLTFLTATWTGGVGDWDTDILWSIATEPTSGDQVVINNGGTVSVTMGGEQAGDVHAGNDGSPGDSGTLNVIGAGQLTVANIVIFGRFPDRSGTLTISAGGQLTVPAVGFGLASGTGTATIDGAGSLLDITGTTALLGDGGTGTLTVSAGGTVSAASIELAADGGTATVNIGNGGAAGMLDADLTVGASPGTATLNFNHSDSVTFSRSIPSGVTVNKLGAGTLTFTGAHTHTTTSVQAGTLLVNGNQPASGVALQGGILGGTGTLGELFATGGTLAPGLSAGMLTVSSVTLNATTTFSVELDGPAAGSDYDQLVATTGVTLGGAALTVDNGSAHATGTAFRIIDNQSGNAVSGTFAGLAEGAGVMLDGQPFVISYAGGDGNDVTLTALGATVLAPGTLPAMTVGAPYSVTFSVSGGIAPYTLAVTAGSLPAGLTLDGTTGELSGMPTTAGTFSFTVAATDSLGGTDLQAYSGTVATAVPSMPVWGLIILAAALLALARARIAG